MSVYWKWIGRLALAIGSVAVSLAALEAFARIVKLDPLLPPSQELRQFRTSGPAAHDAWVEDTRMGFRPRLGFRAGEGRQVYSQFGTLPNSYPLEKRSGVRRLLFLGDSVTARGRVVDAIRKAAGEEKLEYWNAGVESFNTRQAVDFYRFYNYGVNPDEVVLTLHLNDFELTPAVFVSGGNFVVYTPSLSLGRVSRFWFTHSYLFRWILAGMFRGIADDNDIEREMRQALMELKSLTEPRISLTVLVFPLIKPWPSWEPQEQRRHATALRLLTEREIHYFDLLPCLNDQLENRAIAELQDHPGDTWHPSAEFASAIATYLRGRGFPSSSRN